MIEHHLIESIVEKLGDDVAFEEDALVDDDDFTYGSIGQTTIAEATLPSNVTSRRRRTSSLHQPLPELEAKDIVFDDMHSPTPISTIPQKDNDETDIFTLTTSRPHSVDLGELSSDHDDWLTAAIASNSSKDGGVQSEATTTENEDDLDGANLIDAAPSRRVRRQTFNETMKRMSQMTKEERQADSMWEAGLAARRRRSVAI